MRKMLFGLMALAIVGLTLTNTGCRRKKGSVIGTTRGAGDIVGLDGSGDLTADGWQTDRPINMQIIDNVAFDPVYFEYDSTHISETERAKIEAAADYLRRNANVGVIVEGHCDERGSREYNMALGERRALAARAYLIGLGIDGAIIQTKSYGEEQPLAFGHDESAWSANRRAAFVFYNY